MGECPNHDVAPLRKSIHAIQHDVPQPTLDSVPIDGRADSLAHDEAHPGKRMVLTFGEQMDDDR